MKFVNFKNKFFEVGLFNVHQVFAWNSKIAPSTLTRWCSNGYLIKLRNGFYTFPEFLNQSGFSHYIANQIYKPSYISLHYALNSYGLIPEGVSDYTSVTTLKTADFNNKFGFFSYHTLAPSLWFGFKENQIADRATYFASLEKAILDLFYLFPFYNTEQEMKELRFDRNVLRNDLDKTLLFKYLKKFNNSGLKKRVDLLIKTYKIC